MNNLSFIHTVSDFFISEIEKYATTQICHECIQIDFVESREYQEQFTEELVTEVQFDISVIGQNGIAIAVIPVWQDNGIWQKPWLDTEIVKLLETIPESNEILKKATLGD